ncbi:MAG TPA: acetate/propionate family kinase [Candidatus Dormibacteraeota bacterium]|nr:acetate/propionate family kinase [Candidatus Dormibacteraeota bacterium]
MRVLVFNAGSSSLKWSLLQSPERSTLAAGNEPWRDPAGGQHEGQLRAALRDIEPFDAVGHRVVHGGTRFRSATLITAEVRAALESLTAIDPLHMPASLAGIDAVSAAFPAVKQVAAFDTAFHATLPPAAAGYALPHEWTERWELCRFGFHGLSVAYSLERACLLLKATPARLIVCHLGSGSSVTALADGRSIDTSMGFSPLEGVMMATRCGSVDPAVLLYLQEHCGMSVGQLREALEQRSGLLGVSGVSADLRQVLAAADAGVERARLAYQRLILSVRRAVGSMLAVLGGLDALVFTGGIGENSARVRTDVARALAFTGLRLREEQGAGSADRLLSSPESTVAVLLIHAREDLVVLDEVVRLCV